MNNEIQKLHFEVKRINVQLEQLRAQTKHAITTIASLRTELEAISKIVRPEPKEESK